MHFLHWICWWSLSWNLMCYFKIQSLFFSNHALSFILVFSKLICTTRVMIFLLQIWRYNRPRWELSRQCADSAIYNPKKHHQIPADVLPNDSEALFIVYEYVYPGDLVFYLTTMTTTTMNPFFLSLNFFILII